MHPVVHLIVSLLPIRSYDKVCLDCLTIHLLTSMSSLLVATDPETVAKNKVNGVPMKRLGSIDEVIQSVAFLLSDNSSYTTGTNLVVDGGMSSGLKC